MAHKKPAAERLYSDKAEKKMKTCALIVTLLLLVGCHHKHSHHHHNSHPIQEVSHMPKGGIYYEVTKNKQGEKQLIPINIKRKENNAKEDRNCERQRRVRKRG